MRWRTPLVVVVALQLLLGVVALVDNEPRSTTSLDSGAPRARGTPAEAIAPDTVPTTLAELPETTDTTVPVVPPVTTPTTIRVPPTIPLPRELGHGGTYVLNADGSGLRKVLDLGAGWVSGGWINDDSEVLVRLPKGGVGAFNLTTRVMRVVYDDKPLDGPLLISPDGRYLAMSVTNGLVVIELATMKSVSWDMGTVFHIEAWHPTQHRLSARLGNEPPQTVSVDIATGERTVLFPTWSTGSAWSPDGTRIVTANNTGVWITPVASPETRTRISETLFEQPLMWVGDTIIFKTGDHSAGISETGVPRDVLPRNTVGPVWSAKTRRLAALVKERSESATEWGYSLETMTLDGRDKKMLVETLLDTDLYQAIFHVVWSADGTQLAFSANHGLRRS